MSRCQPTAGWCGRRLSSSSAKIMSRPCSVSSRSAQPRPCIIRNICGKCGSLILSSGKSTCNTLTPQRPATCTGNSASGRTQAGLRRATSMTLLKPAACAMLMAIRVPPPTNHCGDGRSQSMRWKWRRKRRGMWRDSKRCARRHTNHMGRFARTYTKASETSRYTKTQRVDSNKHYIDT
jgi:hypothetical protein